MFYSSLAFLHLHPLAGDVFEDLRQIMQKTVMKKENWVKATFFQAGDIISKSSSGPAVLDGSYEEDQVCL